MQHESEIPEQVNFRLSPEEGRRLLELAAGKKHNAYARERFTEWLTPAKPAVDLAPILEQIRELRVLVLRPSDAQKETAERLGSLRDAQKADHSALISHLDRLTKAIEALATPAPAPDHRPDLAAIEAKYARGLWILGSGIGVACLLGIAAILSPLAARRDLPPGPAIDSAAIAREVAAGLEPTIATMEKKQDERDKIIEGAVVKLVDKVQTLARSPVPQSAPTNPAPR